MNARAPFAEAGDTEFSLASSVPAASWHDGMIEDGSELLAEEVPVALVYNGISHAVMLASPQDLEDFAVGFSLSERIVRSPRDVREVEVEAGPHGIALAIDIAPGAMARLKATRRARLGKTGCGLCGIDSLAWFEREMAPHDQRDGGLHEAAGALAPQVLQRAMAAMAGRQRLHQATGAMHAAGWADRDGRLLLVREDVGRHNALDKLVGALARAGIDAGGGFALVTSRASFEMVQKAARAGIGLLAAISAPTAMAVRLADRAGLTLAGFVRSRRHVVYTHPWRLAPTPVAHGT